MGSARGPCPRRGDAAVLAGRDGARHRWRRQGRRSLRADGRRPDPDRVHRARPKPAAARAVRAHRRWAAGVGGAHPHAHRCRIGACRRPSSSRGDAGTGDPRTIRDRPRRGPHRPAHATSSPLGADGRPACSSSSPSRSASSSGSSSAVGSSGSRRSASNGRGWPSPVSAIQILLFSTSLGRVLHGWRGRGDLRRLDGCGPRRGLAEPGHPGPCPGRARGDLEPRGDRRERRRDADHASRR